MSDHIKITKIDGVLTLVMDRPDKMNALTNAMYGVLADALEGSDQDSEVRAIVIRGEGASFTGGNDVGDFASGVAGPRHVTRFIRALATIAKPLVAAVQGKAVGIGTTMLLHCDLVVLAEDAELIAPFVNLALVPEAASSLLLPARIGHARAFSMFALGERVGAQDALAWGLANKVVANADLAAAAEALARRLARQPLGALIATKRLMRATGAITQRMDAESEEFAARLTSPEAQEAFLAFAQRRQPDFLQFA